MPLPWRLTASKRNFTAILDARWKHHQKLLFTNREKLREDALRSLPFTFNRKLRKNLYNGKYQFIACDGSTLDIYIYTNKEIICRRKTGKENIRRHFSILIQPAANVRTVKGEGVLKMNMGFRPEMTIIRDEREGILLSWSSRICFLFCF